MDLPLLGGECTDSYLGAENGRFPVVNLPGPVKQIKKREQGTKQRGRFLFFTVVVRAFEQKNVLARKEPKSETRLA